MHSPAECSDRTVQTSPRTASRPILQVLQGALRQLDDVKNMLRFKPDSKAWENEVFVVSTVGEKSRQADAIKLPSPDG